MNKENHKSINLIILCIIIAIILIGAAYKTNKSYKEKQFSAIEAKIIEKALDCFNHDICNQEKITLEELYEKNYLESLINPLNNEYINPLSFVEISSPNEGKLTIVDE